ncbi:hypothetical protein HJG54_28920 [Leptolyngbya sp. NK1-12]|uniref:Uncharacterized protein n=1 Tax=Leptolyngbya sp. NK1-12 TaxID=2547451 RepID=A0AA96WKV1_9CYAN|nr:hypothetical protein [Leptolyngbya sp. NK1-12]WNZ26950.1 hypothetical protein HJG54_28920 [Leptolyngbya sp. NK1-12]
MVYANFDQYLFTVDTTERNPDLKFATPRGLELFGVLGADLKTLTLSIHLSV